MTSAISRAANAAHAHGFAKSVKNETPVEGFEALFAAVANPVGAPAVSPPGNEPGKPGERAREDEKKAPTNAFELAASIALVAVDADRSEVRVTPQALAARPAVDTVAENAAVAPLPPHVAAPKASQDFVMRAQAPTPAFVPHVSPKEAAKPDLVEMPVAHASHAAPQVRPEALPANPSQPKITANPQPAKAPPMPVVDPEAIVAHAVPPARETRETPAPHAESIEPAKPAARPRVEFSPRALAQAAIVEAMRSPGRGRPQPADESESPAAPNPVQLTAAAQSTPAIVPQPVAEAMTLAADAVPPLAQPIAVSPAPSKPTASSRAAADILRQRHYARGDDASPIGDIVPESAASFETLIALRKADGALEGHASPAVEHESAAPVTAWLPNLPSPASSATTAASALVAPRVFDPTEWSAALAQQVTASALAAAKETTVRVEPDGLGPIEVRVRVEAEHVDVRFAIEHPVTMNMVRAALPDLEKMLAQSGLNLGDAQIAQQNAGQREHAMPNRNASSMHTRDDEPTAVASALESRPRARVGLLDDFV